MKKSSRPRLSVHALEGREVPAVVSGSVFLDANNNGHRDCGEAGIPNVQIKLIDVCGCVRGTAVTDCDGEYAFHCVSPGAYKIVECQPAGYCDGLDARGGAVIPGSNMTDVIWINVCDVDLYGNTFGEVECEKTGRQGLTPGFWKNNAAKWGASAWTGYAPTQTVSSVFGSAFGSLGSLSLEQALGTGGGGINALLRHSVAAVLNAASPSVDYPLTTAQVLSAVQAAVTGGTVEQLKTQLDTYNNYGANLNQHGIAA
ncbi:MAG TPA: SdrD B-like domain-containing protein [Gemmataceae bacterium]|nr:SdrD B-like domain-containing protein [Gemmataceae bacterium]